MPNRRAHSNRPTNSRRSKVPSTLPVLKKIYQSLQEQQTSQVPERPDVQIRSKPKRDRIYPFTQAYVGPSITAPNAGGETDSQISFTLADLPNATSLASVFDRYRIRQARVSFLPVTNQNDITGIIGSATIYTAIDYTDSGPTTINNIVNYDNLKVSNSGAFFERILTPRASIPTIDSSGPNSVSQPSSSQWFDTSSPGVLYNGLKVAITQIGSQTNFPFWTTIITLDLEFQNPH
jgi:hypothetical protein